MPSTRAEVTGRRIGVGHNNPPEPIAPPPPVVDPLALLTKKQLAELLAVDPWTIDRWRKGDPDFPEPIWLSGTTPRWKRVAIDHWLATRQRGGTSPDWQQIPKRKREPTVRRRRGGV
jgi:predicted DNA-binding transcriptional regulator AlpA